MRVLHVIPDIDASHGGTTAALLGLTGAQVQAGLQAAILTCWRYQPSPICAQVRAGGVELHLVGPVRGKLMRHPELRARLQPLIRASDVVHIHAVWEEVQHQAAVLARQCGKPYLICPHGMLDPWSLRNRNALAKKFYLAWRLKADLNRAAAIQFTSTTERDLTAPLKLRAPALVMPNGITLGEFEPLPPPGFLRRRFPQVGDRPIVLFLSRLHPKKGLDLLIPAFAQVPADAGVLVITGPNEQGYQTQVEALVRAHGLTDRVVFTGPLYGADRIAAYVEARLFVLPSYQENFGIVVIEALAAGVPVLISDQVNICADIRLNRVGGVCACDAAALARELTRWLTDDELRLGAAARARPYALETFDWARIARRWVQEYRRLGAADSAGRGGAAGGPN